MKNLLLLAAGALLTFIAVLVFWEPKGSSISSTQKLAQTENSDKLSPEVPSLKVQLTTTDQPWKNRVTLLQQLGEKELSSENYQELLFVLRNHRPHSKDASAWWVVANEIFGQLRKHTKDSDQLVNEFLSIARNANAPVTLRDYAVQHLSQAILRPTHGPDARKTSPQTVVRALTTLKNVILNPDQADSSLPGTSLRLLCEFHELSRHSQKFDLTPPPAGLPQEAYDSYEEQILQRQEENPVSTTIAEHLPEHLEVLTPWLRQAMMNAQTYPLHNRISAVGAAGRLGLGIVRPQLRELVRDETADPALRLNAINSLGMLAQKDDVALLRSIAEGESRYRFAAQTALRKSLN